MNFLQKKQLLIAAINIFIVIIVLVILSSLEKASAKPFYYNQGWLPPRTHQVCNDNFIGVDYNPMYEKRCRVLWDSWTEEILQSNRTK